MQLMQIDVLSLKVCRNVCLCMTGESVVFEQDFDNGSDPEF